MATIDTSLFPSANVRFQMAEAPSGIDLAAIQQQKLANQVTAQNLENAKRTAQRQKMTDAMRDVMGHETPEDAIAAIDRHVTSGDMTPEQAADAKSKVPTRAADGSLPQGAMTAWRQRNFDDYLATNEQLYESNTRKQQQQRLQDILNPSATPAPTNALAPAPADQEQALFNQLNPHPAAPAVAPTNALVSPTQDDNALRQKILALYMEGTPQTTAIAKILESQLKSTSFEEAKLGTYQPGDYTTASWAKFIKTKDPGVLALKPTASQIAASSAATTVAPKLKQGERWNPTQERVEQVPGSAEYIKQSKLHGNDYGAVQAVNSKTSLADKQIDRLLDTANEDAFNNLFGGYNAYVTQRFTGKTAGLKKDLDSLKQNLKSAGLELIKSGGGGAIGTITEREWPILEGMIESLDPTLSEDDARNKLAEIKAKMENLRAMAADKYETTWGETQYYKGGTAAPAAERTYTKEEQQALDWAKANPKDPRAAQIKAKLGVK
jgi:hypothetical protein